MTHCAQKRRIKTQKPPTWLPYSFLMTEFSVLNNVALFPRRIVPPRSPWVCSGISTTTGWGVSGSISVELASLKRKQCRKNCFQKHRPGTNFLLRTFLANSMTAHCRPRHIPSMGILLILAQWAAATFPSIPRVPKPPGIKTPWHEQSCFQALWNLTAFFVFVSYKKMSVKWNSY